MTARKYFGTDGIRGRVGVYPITPDFMMKLGWAVGQVLGGRGKKIIIGKDTRLSGYMFESALEAGLSASGTDILLLGPMSTPGVAYLTTTFRADAGIVISASHNPYHDNGIKFFSAAGTKLPDEIELAIEAKLDEPMVIVEQSQLGRAWRVDDAVGRYVEFCKGTLVNHMNFSGFKIVLDCANGATYQTAPKIFRELGAEVIELGIEPNGLNINANCGATDLKVLQKIVVAEEADLGIAFDGDGDRVMMVDATGKIVDGDQLLFIITRFRQQTGKLKGGVVGTLMTNFGLEVAYQEYGIPFKRAKVGDRYVLEMLHEYDWEYGGESSGHIICLNKTTTGAGEVAALQVLLAMKQSGTSLQALANEVQLYPQVMINVVVKQKDGITTHPSVVTELKAVEQALAGQGRVLLRPSGTEPVIRVMVEGKDKELVAKLAKQLASVVSSL